MEDLFGNFDIEVIDGSVVDGLLTPDEDKLMTVKLKPKDNIITLIEKMKTEEHYTFCASIVGGLADSLGIAADYNDTTRDLLAIHFESERVDEGNIAKTTLVYDYIGEDTATYLQLPYINHETNVCGITSITDGVNVKINEFNSKFAILNLDIAYDEAYYFIKTYKPIRAIFAGNTNSLSAKKTCEIVLSPNLYVKETNE